MPQKPPARLCTQNPPLHSQPHISASQPPHSTSTGSSLPRLALLVPGVRAEHNLAPAVCLAGTQVETLDRNKESPKPGLFLVLTWTSKATSAHKLAKYKQAFSFLIVLLDSKCFLKIFFPASVMYENPGSVRQLPLSWNPKLKI